MNVKPFKEEITQDLQKDEIKPFKKKSTEELDTSMDMLENSSQNFTKSVSLLGSLGTVFAGIFAFILIVVFADTIKSLELVLESSTISSYIYLIGFAVLFIVLIAFSIENFKELMAIRKVEEIKKRFAIQKQEPNEDILPLANILLKRYEGDEEMELIVNSIKDEIKSSSIYKNIYESLDKKLLQNIDKKAKKEIHRASIQGALSTAISPVPLIDMGLILYRSISLTKKIASIYGYRPGIVTTSLLLKQGIINVMFAGVAELASEFTNQATSSTFLAKASKQLGQGAINGILLARLGYGVMEACRPMESNDGKVNFFKMLLESMKQLVLNRK